MLVAHFAQMTQKRWRARDVAAVISSGTVQVPPDSPLALDRLNDDRRSVLRRDLLAQTHVKLVLGESDDFLLRRRRHHTKGVPVRVGRGVHAGLGLVLCDGIRSVASP